MWVAIERVKGHLRECGIFVRKVTEGWRRKIEAFKRRRNDGFGWKWCRPVRGDGSSRREVALGRENVVQWRYWKFGGRRCR